MQIGREQNELSPALSLNHAGTIFAVSEQLTCARLINLPCVVIGRTYSWSDKAPPLPQRERRGCALHHGHDLAGVEDVLRVERPLQGSHQVDGDWVLVEQQLVAFYEPDARLGRDRAVHAR